MKNPMLILLAVGASAATGAKAQSATSCADLATQKFEAAEITAKIAYRTQIYREFLYDAGITMKGPVSGLLALGKNGLFGPYTFATEFDVDKAAIHASDRFVEPASTHLSASSGNGGKLIFFHGDSDPWFSPLDTQAYCRSLAEANDGTEKVAEWSRIFLVPGMAHGGGGPALDPFDMLTAVVNWVGKNVTPDWVVATSAVFPGPGHPLCASEARSVHGNR